MKYGLVVSGLLVLFLCVFVAINLVGGSADRATSATASAKLVAMSFPDDLPQFFSAPQPEADATGFYAQAVKLYEKHGDRSWSGQEPDPELAGQLAALLGKAMERGQVDQGFLDQRMKLQVGPIPGVETWEVMCTVVLAHGADLAEQGDTHLAKQASASVWVMGQRAFERNTLLSHRLAGLALMRAAGADLYQWGIDEDMKPPALEAWAGAIEKIQKAWESKRKIIFSARPNIGDLVNLARHDQDLTFRVAATLRLGIFQYAPGGKGNLQAINAAITEARASDKPLLAQAGAAAAALTRQEMRRLH